MDIDNGISSAFHDFHPTSAGDSVDLDSLSMFDRMAFQGKYKGNEEFAPLIKLCDQKTMNHWYDFCKWYYCKSVLGGDAFEPDFDFEISPLMRFAMECCDVCVEKYTVDHLQHYSCEICDGDGYIDDDECEDCHGTGEDNELMDDECRDTINGIDTSVFSELSKITSELLD